MSYSRWQPPRCIGKITVKPECRRGYFGSGDFCAAFLDPLAFTWIVFNWRTGIVDAMFHGEPNGHGWSAPEAHAKSHCRGLDRSWNPADLDNIP